MSGDDVDQNLTLIANTSVSYLAWKIISTQIKQYLSRTAQDRVRKWNAVEIVRICSRSHNSATKERGPHFN
jgi:hypothetical protein